MKGTVKWYDRVKGYGFLQTEDNKDIFIHRSGLEVSHTELEAGQTVEFEIEQREKGPVAIKVKKVDWEGVVSNYAHSFFSDYFIYFFFLSLRNSFSW
jgi:CspA family cold shock protein